MLTKDRINRVREIFCGPNRRQISDFPLYPRHDLSVLTQEVSCSYQLVHKIVDILNGGVQFCR